MQDPSWENEFIKTWGEVRTVTLQDEYFSVDRTIQNLLDEVHVVSMQEWIVMEGGQPSNPGLSFISAFKLDFTEVLQI